MAQANTSKQVMYVWSGTDARGKFKKGEIAATSLPFVRAQLRKQGIRPIKVKRKPKPLFSASKPKIKPADIAIFTRQMATMMKAGIPLVQSFEIVGQALENASVRELVATIRDDVSSGNNLADSIRKHPRYFDDLYCNLIEAGEQSGTLETMLDRLATYREKSEALRSKIKKAMNYPIAVVVIAIIVTGILLVKVVPAFADTFKSFGAELPAFTQLIMRISDIAIAWWWIVLVGMSVLFFAYREAMIRSKVFRERVERLTLKIPAIGLIIEQSSLARFSRTLATTFSAGVPLVEALDSVAGATGNVVYRNATISIRDDVTSGLQLTQAIRSTDVFPNMVIQMVSIGEETGALDSMLDKCANYYEAEVDNAVDGLTALMEPVIMSVLGILIGGLLVAMYLPIFNLGQVI